MSSYSGFRTIHRMAVEALVALLLATAGLRAQAADAERLRAELRTAVEQAGRFDEKGYSIASWTKLRFTWAEGNDVLRNDKATPMEMRLATTKLAKAVAELEERPAVPIRAPQIALSAWLFATDRQGPIDNVALMWAGNEECQSFEVQRSRAETGPYETIYRGSGMACQDYALPQGTLFYRLVGHRKEGDLVSPTVSAATMAMPANLREYSNEASGQEGLPGKPLKVGDTYYAYHFERAGKGVGKVVLRTSPDGRNWQDGPVVLTGDSHPDLADCKFESGSRFYDKINDQIVWWAHWERSGPSYGHGRAFVATAKPGKPFKVHHVYNPLGIQVRDMSVFVDDDGKGYVVAASNAPGQGANATLYVFSLNKTYDDVTGIVAKVMEGAYREAPHILRVGGFYYLFFSQAAGWYPSRAAYVSSRSLAGPWSEARSIGNSSTFSAQSGGIIEYGYADSRVPFMSANRWVRGEGTSRSVVLPIHFASGFAFFDYSPTLLHDPERNLIVPLHAGRLLSQDRPATSSVPGAAGRGVEKALDGDYDSFYQSSDKRWPFTLGTDLGALCRVRNVQVSWYIHKGSEAYYRYQIEGSLDGKRWYSLLDRSDPADTTVSRTYGFTSDLLPDGSLARHVRLRVLGAVLHNNPNNWYTPTVYELKAFGQEAGAIDPSTTVAVVGDVPRGATIVGHAPEAKGLARQVSVLTAGDGEASAEVEWDFAGTNFATAFDVVAVAGTVKGTGLPVHGRVEVVPEHLLYFVDIGSGKQSQPYDAVANVARLLNQQPDQPWTTGADWGYEGKPRIKGTDNIDATDKFQTGIYAMPLTYVVTLPQAGTYRLVLGATDWWAGNKKMTVTAQFTDRQGRRKEVLIGRDVVRDKGRVTRIEAPVTVDGRTTVRIVGTGDAAYSFIGIARETAP